MYSRYVVLTLVGLMLGTLVGTSQAQVEPTERQQRTQIPPNQMVSFAATTNFEQFIGSISPIVERELGKPIVDPTNASGPINVPVSGMHYLDALETVLAQKGLTYRETENYLIIEQPEQEGTQQMGQAAQEESQPPADARSQEVRIDAVFFELDVNRARELGINWTAVFGPPPSSQGGRGGQGGAGGGRGGQQEEIGIDLAVKTEPFIDEFEEYITVADEVEFSEIMSIFRVFEQNGIGETIANPSVSVQSGQEGRVQIGTEIPIQIRDFAGNTTTEFVQTGLIVNVTPTVIHDTVQTDTGTVRDVDFIHLDVRAENSSAQSSPSGPIISTNEAETQTLMINGEQTVIGGLTTTEQSENRQGIPILKDLPPWFFGLRYVFGFTTTDVRRKELLIVLEARTRESLMARSEGPRVSEDLLQREREEFRNRLMDTGTYSERSHKSLRLQPPAHLDMDELVLPEEKEN